MGKRTAPLKWAALLGGAALALALVLNVDLSGSLRAPLEEFLGEALGSKVEVGKVSVSLWPLGLRLAEVQSQSTALEVHAPGVQASLRARALLRGTVEVSLRAESPRVRVVQEAKRAPPTPSEARGEDMARSGKSSPLPGHVVLSRVVVSGADVLWVPLEGKPLGITGLDLEVSELGTDRDVGLRGSGVLTGVPAAPAQVALEAGMRVASDGTWAAKGVLRADLLPSGRGAQEEARFRFALEQRPGTLSLVQGELEALGTTVRGTGTWEPAVGLTGEFASGSVSGQHLGRLFASLPPAVSRGNWSAGGRVGGAPSSLGGVLVLRGRAENSDLQVTWNASRFWPPEGEWTARSERFTVEDWTAGGVPGSNAPSSGAPAAAVPPAPAGKPPRGRLQGTFQVGTASALGETLTGIQGNALLVGNRLKVDSLSAQGLGARWMAKADISLAAGGPTIQGNLHWKKLDFAQVLHKYPEANRVCDALVDGALDFGSGGVDLLSTAWAKGKFLVTQGSCRTRPAAELLEEALAAKLGALRLPQAAEVGLQAAEKLGRRKEAEKIRKQLDDLRKLEFIPQGGSRSLRGTQGGIEIRKGALQVDTAASLPEGTLRLQATIGLLTLALQGEGSYAPSAGARLRWVASAPWARLLWEGDQPPVVGIRLTGTLGDPKFDVDLAPLVARFQAGAAREVEVALKASAREAAKELLGGQEGPSKTLDRLIDKHRDTFKNLFR